MKREVPRTVKVQGVACYYLYSLSHYPRPKSDKIVQSKDEEASNLDQHSMPAPMINEETRSLEQLLHADVLDKGAQE